MLPLFFTTILILPSFLGALMKPEDGGQIWAVLVAGSNDWGNYRHQADICHAYQILHRHGVPDSNIIVMMYDDIANNPANPNKGVIINRPKGPNVYKGVPKDYTGDDVTPKNFINVLTGNSTAVEGIGSGKVLKSLVLGTRRNNSSLNSGGVHITPQQREREVLATTAANRSEPSHGCYYVPELDTLLGDEYSISWMEDTDNVEGQKKLSTHTVYKQFQNVLKRVTNSHPQMYGDKTMKKDLVVDFLGSSKKSVLEMEDSITSEPTCPNAIPSEEVAVEILNIKIKGAKSSEERERLEREKDVLIKGREVIDELFDRILLHITQLTGQGDFVVLKSSSMPVPMDMMICYRTLIDNFTATCVDMDKNTYPLRHMHKLSNLCVSKYSEDDVIRTFSAECTEHHRALVGIH